MVRVCIAFLALISTVFSEWTILHRAPADAPIRLHIGLKTADAHVGLAKVAQNIADPDHDQYRKHLSAQQLQTLLTVPASGLETVTSWLREVGVAPSSIQQRGHVLDAVMSIEQADALLDATYSVYAHGRQEIIRTEFYRLRNEVRNHIDFITPTNNFPAPVDGVPLPVAARRDPMVRRDNCGTNDNTTPSCIRQIYNITYTPKPNRTTFAVYATEASSFKPNDLQKFLQDYNRPAADAHATFNLIGTGDPANGMPGIESAFETALDTQTALGLAFPAGATLYDFGGVFGPHPGQTYDRFVQFLQDLMHNDTVPAVVSFSESNTENQFDPTYARSLCTMLMAIGTRGVTLVFSSGNNGAQGNEPTTKHRDVFEPKFPASCPFVLSVGGTTDLADEKGATKKTIQGLSKAGFTASGGGFSNYFNRPAYQDAAVQDYVTNHIPESYYNKSGFCANGRGIPDVSAFSTSFPIYYNGLMFPIGGTSAAAPTWAAIITLLNDYEASQGRPALGFVNPWLYSLRDGALKDIVMGGDNSGDCQLLSECKLSETPGYNVTKGWDPVTGLGSPLVSKLMAALDERAKANATNGSSSTGSASAPFADFSCGSFKRSNGGDNGTSSSKSPNAAVASSSSLSAAVVSISVLSSIAALLIM